MPTAWEDESTTDGPVAASRMTGDSCAWTSAALVLGTGATAVGSTGVTGAATGDIWEGAGEVANPPRLSEPNCS